MTKNKLKTIVEVLIFVSNKPLSINKIANIIEKNREEVNDIIHDLQTEYLSDNKPFFIQEVSGGFTFATKPEYSPWIKKLFGDDKNNTLSKAAIETLAIIAYNQPITRMEIEKMRGVDSSSVLLKLLKDNYVTIKGRKKIPGNPFLYRVTEKFLLHFGLNSIKDLPPLDELGLSNEKD